VRTPFTIIDPPVVLRPSTPQGSSRNGGGRPADVAVWDVDGTLVLGDTLMPFLRRLVGTAAVARIVLGNLAHSPGAGQRRDAAKAAVLQQALGGRELTAVDEIARSYVTDLVMRRLRPDCLRLWQWHRARGHHLVLASASPELYLRHLGALLGADRVISTEMVVVNGRLTGQLATPNCRGEHKAARVREYLDARPHGTVWVYANGSSDRPTLALADIPVWVRPYRPLRTASADRAAGTGNGE
jgi:phosphatidylglycerophosphatase C